MADKGKSVVWILGSGFSRSLGGPLLDDLLSERGQAEARARCGPACGNIHDFYWKHLKGYRGQNGATYWRDAEEFLDFIQTAAATEDNPRRKIFVDSDPAELHRLALLAVASECLFDAHASREAEAWQPYIGWAQRLRPGDTIITFNYDCVIDSLIGWHPEHPFRVPEPPPGTSNLESGVINVLKLHGSVNWFEDKIVRTGVNDVIKRLQSGQPPILGTPGPSKRVLSTTTFQPLWESAVAALNQADVVVFMGYRFPPSDSQARSELLGALRANDQRVVRVHTVLGPRTGDDHTVRLVKLLEHSLRGKGRITPKENRSPKPGHVPPSYEILPQPLYVEDFLTVIHDEELYGPY